MSRSTKGALLLGPLLVALVSLHAAAQSSLGAFEDHAGFPETPAARRAQEFLAVLNAGDRERAESFSREALDPAFWGDLQDAGLTDWILGVHEHHGVFADYHVRTYGGESKSDEIVVVMHTARTDLWMGLQITVDPEPPYRVRALTINRARPPAEAPETPLTPPAFAEALGRYAEGLAAQDLFSGAVLVARDGEVLYQAAFGEASKRFHVPNRTDTRFNIASMTKMFTAVSVGQLVERGKLALDDPVGRHLPRGWLGPDLRESITVRQLLTHTSGLGDYLDHPLVTASPPGRFRSIDDYRPIFEGARPAFRPGEDWGYSNMGFLLLGKVIEEVSGTSYDAYLAENVYGPAGMTMSGRFASDRPVENLAIGYVRTDDGWENNLFKRGICGTSAGGTYSTVGDLLAFDRALRSGKLLGAAMREELWTATPLSRKVLPYGMGFTVSGKAGDEVVGHAGGTDGVSGRFEMYLDTGVTVIVLSNYDGVANTLAQKAAELAARLAR